MASYLQIENISKSYGLKVLFDRISFNVNEGDKIALIAPNGAGKTSLMRILAGKDRSDSGGKVLFLKDIRIAFLEQDYDFDPQNTIAQQIGDSLRTRELLTSLGLGSSNRLMGELSGGEVKRVALTQMLASEADFFIMDEPTNHLDVDAIEFLESYLSRSRCTLLMVTHDRDFLQGLTNKVYEFRKPNIKEYIGDIYDFLEQKNLNHLKELEIAAKQQPQKVVAETVSQNKINYERKKQIDAKLRKVDKEIQRLEEAIGKLEAELAEQDAIMAHPDEHPDIKIDNDWYWAYGKKKEELQALMDDWGEKQMERDEVMAEYDK